MTTRGRVAVFGAGLLALAIQASASEISWTFQRVEQGNPGPSPMISLGMRTGATWPTVFYEPSSSPISLVASSLTPVGWAKSTLDTLSSPSYVRSAAGTDGRLGAAWQYGQSGPAIKFGQLTSAGWQYSTVATLNSQPSSSGTNAPDVAYLPGNRPVVAYADPSGSKIKVAVQNAQGWETEAVSYPTGGPPNGTFVSTAVNTQGDIGVAYCTGSNVIYAQKSLPGGTWSYVDLGTGFPGVRNVSLAYGPHDEAGMAVLYANGSLAYAHFDIQAGGWRSEVLVPSGVASPRVELVFDGAGHPALSYVAAKELAGVHYQTNDGNGWLDVALPTGIDPVSNLNVTPILGSDAALALDREGVPVISYYTQSGLVLAYDPVVTPEPATLLAVTAGVALISRRRRRA